MRFTLVLTLFTLIGYAADATEDLLAAVRKGDLPAVKALLDNGANVNAKSPYGATPLFFAADRGNIEMVKLLLQRGADVDVKDTFYGATALTWAAEKERIDILKLLLAKSNAGADDVLESGVREGQSRNGKSRAGQRRNQASGADGGVSVRYERFTHGDRRSAAPGRSRSSAQSRFSSGFGNSQELRGRIHDGGI